MIDYPQALGMIRNAARQMQPQHCLAAAALGRVLAAAVISEEFLPPFDNSAMDGFALQTGGRPLRGGAEFDVAGSQGAGDGRQCGDSGSAWEIMTGARLPDGLDAVIPVEQVDILQRDADGCPSRIRLGADVHPGQHVRRRGEDVMRGAVVMPAGTLLEPSQLMVLAGLGVSGIVVAGQPRVALINTGRELVDDPAQALEPGQIRNSNGPFLAARIAAAGARLVYQQTVGDEPEAFHAALTAAQHAGAEIVLSTGAVSMGRYDFIPDALRSIGAEIRFHKVRIRPGKPLLFATLADGALFFGLPGNPASSAVGLRFFVEPALRKMLGLAPERPLRLPLVRAQDKKIGLRFHLKGRVECDRIGQLRANALQGQESFRIRPLLAANAWIVMDDQALSLQAGELVDVYSLGHLQPQVISTPGSGQDDEVP